MSIIATSTYPCELPFNLRATAVNVVVYQSSGGGTLRPSGDPEMKPYTATGRHGTVNIRHFRKAMTHAVDVDGLVWKFFPSEVKALEYAANRAAEGYDAVVVLAEPYIATDDHSTEPQPRPTQPSTSATGIDSFADRLKHLMNTGGYEAEDLAAALQDAGVSLAEHLVARLIAGIGGLPSDSTIDAIARFFEVEPDLFFDSADGEMEEVIAAKAVREAVGQRQSCEHVPTRVEPDSQEPGFTPSHHVISMSSFGRLIQGLSDATDRCLERSGSDLVSAVRLTRAITSASEQLRLAEDTHVAISSALLEEIVIAWARSAPSNTPSRGEYLWAAELLGESSAK